MFFFSALSTALALYVVADAHFRSYLKNGLAWAALTLAAYPIGLPLYLAYRPLKEGQSREGGRGWNFLKYFALVWTFGVFVFAVRMTGIWAEKGLQEGVDPIVTGIDGIFSFFGVALMWFIPVITALIIGLFVKTREVETA